MNYLLPVSVTTDVEKRVKLLKENQKEIARAMGQYHKERHALKRKQHLEFVQPFYDKVAKVVRGEHEPTDREGRWYLDDEDEDTTEDVGNSKKKGRENGVPDYWLTVLENSCELVQVHDGDILTFLDDIKCTPTDEGFLLEFIFVPNDFFENTTLSKTYLLKFTPDEDNVYNYVGPKIYKSIGCRINWKKPEVMEKDEDEGKGKKGMRKGKKGKKKSAKKKEKPFVSFMQRHRKTFFKFFEAPNVSDDVKFSDMDPFDQRDLKRDIENGELFIYNVIGNSVNYFIVDKEEEGDEDNEEDEEDEEEYETDENEDEEDEKKGFFSRLFGR